MTEREYFVTAKITGTITYCLKDRWSSEATMAEVHEQAKRQAIGKINHALNGNGGIDGDPLVHIEVKEVRKP